jgi:hypothetical protein
MFVSSCAAHGSSHGSTHCSATHHCVVGVCSCCPQVVILLYDGKPIELPGLQAPDLFQSTVMKLVTGTPAEQLTQADTHHGQQFVFPSNLIQTRQMDLPMGELEEGAASYRYSDNSSRGGLGSEVLYPPQEPHSSAGGSSMPEVQDSREAAAAAPQERHGPGAGQLHQATAGKQAASTSGLDDYMCEDVSGGGCAPQPMPPITEDHTQEDLAHLAADQSPQIHSRSAARSVPTRSPASQQMRSSEQVSWHNPLWAHGAVCLRLNAAPWLVRPASAAATPSRGPTFSSGGGSVADPRYAPASAAAAGQPLPQLPAPSPPYQAEAPPHNQGQAAGDSRSKGSSSQGSDRSGDSAQLPASMAAPPSACVLQACPSGQLQHSEAGPTLYRCSADAAGHSPARQQVPAAGVLSGISPGRARGRSRSEGGLPQPNHHEQYPAVAAGSRSPGTPGLPALQPASSAPVLRASTAQSHASAAAAGNHYKSLSIAVDTSSRPASPRHVFGAHAIYSPVRGHPASESGVPRHHRLQAAHGPSLPGRTSAPPLTSSGQAVSSTMGRSSHSDSVWGSVHSSHLSNKQGPGTGRQRGNRNGGFRNAHACRDCPHKFFCLGFWRQVCVCMSVTVAGTSVSSAVLRVCTLAALHLILPLVMLHFQSQVLLWVSCSRASPCQWQPRRHQEGHAMCALSTTHMMGLTRLDGVTTGSLTSHPLPHILRTTAITTLCTAAQLHCKRGTSIITRGAAAGL